VIRNLVKCAGRLLLASILACSTILTNGIFLEKDIEAKAMESNGESVLFRTTLNDRTTKADRLTFDVWASDKSTGTKIDKEQIKVINNDKNVAINWADSEKTSFTLYLTEGENKVTIQITNGSDVLTKGYTIIQEHAENGETIGDLVFSMDTFVLGLGYLIEPQRISITKGLNSAQILDQILKTNNFTYKNTGTLQSSFYLAHVQSEKTKVFSANKINVPLVIKTAGAKMGITIDEKDYQSEKSLGEFDFSQGSGWMYAVNNIFPNVGFADTYPQDGDVMRTQYTLLYGSDLGGGMIGENSFDPYSKDGATKALAYINSSDERQAILQDPEVASTYDEVMKEIAVVNPKQQDLDEATGELDGAVIKWVENHDQEADYEDDYTDEQLQAIENIRTLEKEINELPEIQAITMDELEHVNALQQQIDQLPTNQQKLIDNLHKLIEIEQRLQQIQDAKKIEEKISQLPSVDEVTLSSNQAIQEIRTAYDALNEDLKNMITNYAVFEAVETKYKQLEEKQQHIKEMTDKLETLMPISNLTLADEEKVEEFRDEVNQYNAEGIEVENDYILDVAELQLQRLMNKKAQGILAEIAKYDLPNTSETYLEITPDIVEMTNSVVDFYNTSYSSFLQKYYNFMGYEERISFELESLPLFDHLVIGSGYHGLPLIQNFTNGASTLPIDVQIYDQLSDWQHRLDALQGFTKKEDGTWSYSPDNEMDKAKEVYTAYKNKEIKVKTSFMNEVSDFFINDQEKFQAFLKGYLSRTTSKEEVADQVQWLSNDKSKMIKYEALSSSMLDNRWQNFISNHLLLYDLIKNNYDQLNEEDKATISWSGLDQNYEKARTNWKTAVLQPFETLKDIEPSALTEKNYVEVSRAAYLVKHFTQRELAMLEDTDRQNIETFKTRQSAYQERRNQGRSKRSEIIDFLKLPELKYLTVEDKTDFEAILSKYTVIKEESQQFGYLLFPDHLDSTMDAISEKITELEQVRPLIEAIEALPIASEIRQKDVATIENIKEQYEPYKPVEKEPVTIEYCMEVQFNDPECDIFMSGGSEDEEIKGISAETLAQAYYKKIEHMTQRLEDLKVTKVVDDKIAALPAVDDLKVTDEPALKEVRESVTTLTAEQKELLDHKDQYEKIEKEFIDVQKAYAVEEQINNLPSNDEIMLKHQSIIAETRKNYDTLTDHQKELVKVLSKLEGAEATYTSIAKVKSINDMIANLPDVENLVEADNVAITQARAAFEALTKQEQESVRSLGKLEKLEEAIQQLVSATEKIKHIVSLIQALPSVENIKITDKKEIEEVRAAYDALTETQKLRVTNFDSFIKAEEKLAALIGSDNPDDITPSVEQVNNLIQQIPNLTSIKLTDGTLIEITWKAYNALSNGEKQQVSNAYILTTAKAIYDDLKAQDDAKKAQAVAEKIATLPSVSLIDLTDETLIKNVKNNYDQLTDSQKQLVLNNGIISELEARLATMKEAALKVKSMIATLPETSKITETDRKKIEEIRTTYTALTTAQKQLVTNSIVLDQAELQLAQLQEASIKKLIKEIDNLPITISLKDEKTIRELRLNYDNLKIQQQALVTNYVTLKAAEKTLENLINKDKETAEKIVKSINDLPSKITVKDQPTVEIVRKAYNALTESQQIYVSNLAKLEAAEKVLATIKEADQKKAKKVDDSILQLPTTSKVTLDDEAMIASVRKAYNALTTTQRQYVKDYATLKKLEAKLATLQQATRKPEIDIPTIKNTSKTIEGYVTPSSKVVVYKGSKKIKTAKVDKNGFYKVTIPLQKKNTKLKFVVYNQEGKKLIQKTVNVKAATVTAASSVKATTTKIMGKAPKGKTVKVYKGSKLIGKSKSSKKSTFVVKMKKQKKGTKLKIIVLDSVGNKSKTKTVTIK